MAIILTRQPQFTRDNISGNVDYLNGSFFTKYVVNIEFRVETFVKPTPDNVFTFGDNAYQTDDFISNSIGGFAEFNVGDEIEIDGCTGVTDGNYIIVEKPSDNTVRVTDDLGGAVNFGFNVLVEDGIIRSLVEPLAIRYDFGLIENDAPFNFKSLVDGQEQYYDYTHPTQIPTSFQDMTPNGKLSWQVGLSDGAQVKRVSSDATTGNYVFQVEHTFFIVPFFLPNQLLKLRKSTPEPPNYYDLEKCLKQVFRLRSFATASEPNVFQELEVTDKLGDTGWAEEIRNGKQPEYSLASISYDTNSIGQLIVGDANDITIEIDELNGVAGAYVTLNFIALPEQDEDYRDINFYMYQNYVFDRAEITVGGATVQGETQGTGWQVLTDCSATTAANVTTISATIDFGADAITKLGTLSDKRYLIVAEVMGATQTAGDDNMTPVICDVNQTGIEIADATIDVTTNFLPHNVNSYTTGGSQDIILSRDEVVGDTILKVDKTLFTSCLLDEVTIQLIAKDADEVAVLSERIIDISGNQEINGARFVDLLEPLAYNVLPTEIRKNVQMIRRTDLDDSTYNVYQISFPFMFRWEYWKQLVLAQLPTDFLDTSQDFNGYNHEWDRLGDFSGWGIYYRLVTKLTCDGKQGTITTDKEITHYTYDENTDWTLKEIKLFDDTTELTYSGQYYIKDGINTKVVATFENANSIDFSEYYMEFILSPKEIGDQFSITTFSSVYDRSSISQFTSNDDTGKILIEQVDATTIKGTAYIDDTKFNKNYGEYTISARVKSKITPIPFVSTWNTENLSTGSSATSQVKLPLLSSGTYDFEVDWGDGNTDTITVWNQSEVTHTYSSTGDYTITILGQCHGWNFQNAGDRNKITTITQWGNGLRFGSATDVFEDCEYLTHVIAEDYPDLSDTISLKSYFQGCDRLEVLIANNWQVGHIISLREFLATDAVSVLTRLEWKGWDTSSVINRFRMLYNVLILPSVDIRDHDYSKTSDLERAFYRTLPTGDLKGIADINISSLTKAAQMLNFTTLDTSTFSNLYFKWSSQAPNIQSNVPFDGGGSKYFADEVDSGTASGTNPNELIDGSKDFTNTVTIGDVVFNDTNNTYARVTNVTATVLTLDIDIMTSGEDYSIQSSNAAKGKAKLIIDYSWTIDDGGYE